MTANIPLPDHFLYQGVEESVPATLIQALRQGLRETAPYDYLQHVPSRGLAGIGQEPRFSFVCSPDCCYNQERRARKLEGPYRIEEMLVDYRQNTAVTSMLGTQIDSQELLSQIGRIFILSWLDGLVSPDSVKTQRPWHRELASPRPGLPIRGRLCLSSSRSTTEHLDCLVYLIQQPEEHDDPLVLAYGQIIGQRHTATI